MINYNGVGSYITVEPLSSSNETQKGRVFADNKGYKKGSIVYYHRNDCKAIIIDGQTFHVIKYYDLILIEVIEKPKKYSTPTTITFNGLGKF